MYLGDVGRGEDHDVGEALERVQLSQQRVDGADGVARLPAAGRRIARRRQALHLVYEHKHQAVLLLHQLPDLGEQPVTEVYSYVYIKIGI